MPSERFYDNRLIKLTLFKHVKSTLKSTLMTGHREFKSDSDQIRRSVPISHVRGDACEKQVHPPRVSSYSSRRTFDARGNAIQARKIAPDSAMMNGCNTRTPFACASAPTANGRIAAPLPPKAAVNPIELTWRCRGRSLVTITTAPGNRGPRKKPWSETATADT